MPASTFSSKSILLVIGDAFVFGLSLLIALLIRHHGLPDANLLGLYIFAAPFLLIFWMLGLIVFGLYDIRSAKNDIRFFDRLGRGIATNALATILLFYFIPEFRLTPLVTFFVIFAVQAVLLFCWRLTYNATLAKIARDRVLFFGVGEEVREVADHLRENPQLGYEAVCGIRLSSAEANGGGWPFPLFDLETAPLAQLVTERGIRVIVISGAIKTNALLMRILFEAIPLGVTITEFPRFYELIMGKIPVSRIGEVWFLENLIGSHRPRYDLFKRSIDLAAVTVIGLIALPFIPVIAIAIFLSTPRDVWHHASRRARPGDGIIFFRQPRVGRNGRVFHFIKFRSQVLGAEKFGGEKMITEDPRSYPVGTFLRKSYLDELPQLWNVIRGDMSLVGPRPERPEFVAELAKSIPFYRMRELVLPGITGWAQMNMENDASVSDAPEKLQYDLFYIKNRSILLDIAILLRTAVKLLQRSGR